MFSFFKRRKEQQEIERKMQVRQSRRLIERSIQRQKQKISEYWGLAKRAARTKDRKMFELISTRILKTQKAITEWEKYMIHFDMLETERDQTLAAEEFFKAYEAMAKSMLAVSDPANMAQIQRDIEMAKTRAEMMGDALENLVGMSEGMLSDMSSIEQDPELRQIMQAIESEATQEAQGIADADIEASLRAIEEQLGKA